MSELSWRRERNLPLYFSAWAATGGTTTQQLANLVVFVRMFALALQKRPIFAGTLRGAWLTDKGPQYHMLSGAIGAGIGFYVNQFRTKQIEHLEWQREKLQARRALE